MKFSKRTEKVIQMVGNRACTIVADVYEPETPRGTIFCIHGLLGSGSDFEEMAGFLAGNGLRSICPDLLGRGRSTYLNDPDGYDMSVQQETIRTLFSRFGTGMDSVIGTGSGAVLAFLVTRSAIVAPARLVLADLVLTSSPALTGQVQLSMELVNKVFKDPQDVGPFVDGQAELLGIDSGQFNHAALERNLRKDADGFKLGCDSTIVFSLDKSGEFDLGPMLRAATVPTLLLYGSGSVFHDVGLTDKITDINPYVKCISNYGKYNTISFDDFHAHTIIFGFLSQV